jgi:hypothetical protein
MALRDELRLELEAVCYFFIGMVFLGTGCFFAYWLIHWQPEYTYLNGRLVEIGTTQPPFLIFMITAMLVVTGVSLIVTTLQISSSWINREMLKVK